MDKPDDDSKFNDSEPSDEAGVVCTACVEVNAPHTNYCAACGAPLNSLLAFNAFDQTLVEGFAYRRAVDGPPSRLVLAGMWLLFGPALITAPLLASNSESVTDAGRAALLAHQAFWSFYFLLSALLLFRTTTNYFAKRRDAQAGSG